MAGHVVLSLASTRLMKVSASDPYFLVGGGLDGLRREGREKGEQLVFVLFLLGYVHWSFPLPRTGARLFSLS